MILVPASRCSHLMVLSRLIPGLVRETNSIWQERWYVLLKLDEGFCLRCLLSLSWIIHTGGKLAARSSSSMDSTTSWERRPLATSQEELRFANCMRELGGIFSALWARANRSIQLSYSQISDSQKLWDNKYLLFKLPYFGLTCYVAIDG